MKTHEELVLIRKEVVNKYALNPSTVNYDQYMEANYAIEIHKENLNYTNAIINQKGM